MGGISLALTALNLIVIVGISMGVAKLKEVAPGLIDPENKEFWKDDIKNAREKCKTLQGNERADLERAIDEFERRVRRLPGRGNNEENNNEENNHSIRRTGARSAAGSERGSILLKSLDGSQSYQRIINRLPNRGGASRLPQGTLPENYNAVMDSDFGVMA